MIKALDENPEKCGYSKAQITIGLQALASKSIKQIGSDAGHLYYMMLNKNLIDNNDFTRKAAKKHNEVMKLRFDQERSNLEDLPKYIRKPLFEILSQYSDGAVKRINNQWTEIEINEDFLNELKYKYNEE